MTGLRRTVSAICVIAMSIWLLAGCSLFLGPKPLKKIDGDIECVFRTGKNARVSDEIVDTDVVFEKEKFIELYNEYCQYNPYHLKNHLNECDMKINPDEDPEAWDEIFNSEVSIKAVWDDDSKCVSVYRYDSKLYFFVLSMGGRSEPHEQGYYYMELSDEMDEYWCPIIEEVTGGEA